MLDNTTKGRIIGFILTPTGRVPVQVECSLGYARYIVRKSDYTLRGVWKSLCWKCFL